MVENGRLDVLIATALDARRRAYAPYSQFAVGAAVLTAAGDVFAGCNIENASYGLTICAERVALHSAVAAGQREFRALAAASSGGAPPCGLCRQALAEFCDELEIVLVDSAADGRWSMVRLAELLPRPFGPDALKKK